jgi:hypothetical protein
MMLPTIDEDNQVLFNIEGNIEECTRCYFDENTSFRYIHDDCENQKMLPNLNKEYQEIFDINGDIKRDNDSNSHCCDFPHSFRSLRSHYHCSFPHPLRWLRSHLRSQLYKLKINHSTIFEATDMITVDQQTSYS